MEQRRVSLVNVEKRQVYRTDFPSLPLPEEILTKLVDDSKDWAHANGLVMRTPEAKNSSDLCMIAPFSLLPAPFPAELFEEAVQVQDSIARLYHQIAYDVDFLLKCHAEVVETDAFTRGLCDILKTIHSEGLTQRKTLVIQRSDYMCHKDKFTSEYTLKQVEVNNIASSMGAHAERVGSLHLRNLRELGVAEEVISSAIPPNSPVHMIARSLFLAWKEFGAEDGVILVVVEDVNQNQIDQRHVEYELTKQGVPSRLIIRRSLTELHTKSHLDEQKHLVVDGGRVSVVYFRSGYAPSHYPSEAEWAARLKIERSDAIKAPWIGLQVANTKKVQQVLAEDGELERFLRKPAEAAAVRRTFAGLWSLDPGNPISEKMIKHAIAHPAEYVLKPQLEGGGGNFYGQEVAEKLQSFSAQERAAHILMERFHPLVVQSYMVRANLPVSLVEIVSELGIYGYAFGDDSSPAVVATGGHLIRSKGQFVDEGGVAVGAAVIDSPFLFRSP